MHVLVYLWSLWGARRSALVPLYVGVIGKDGVALGLGDVHQPRIDRVAAIKDVQHLDARLVSWCQKPV